MKVSGILLAILQSDKIIKNMDLPACRNCIYYKPSITNDYTSTLNKCEKFGEKDIISDKIRYKYADTCRLDEKLCGHEGKYFKEDPNVIAKIVLHKLISTIPFTIPVFLMIVNIIRMIK
jgi:hypothetical protein